jgi:hypothetical protein
MLSHQATTLNSTPDYNNNNNSQAFYSQASWGRQIQHLIQVAKLVMQ